MNPRQKYKNFVFESRMIGTIVVLVYLFIGTYSYQMYVASRGDKMYLGIGIATVIALTILLIPAYKGIRAIKNRYKVLAEEYDAMTS